MVASRLGKVHGAAKHPLKRQGGIRNPGTLPLMSYLTCFSLSQTAGQFDLRPAAFLNDIRM